MSSGIVRSARGILGLERFPLGDTLQRRQLPSLFGVKRGERLRAERGHRVRSLISSFTAGRFAVLVNISGVVLEFLKRVRERVIVVRLQSRELFVASDHFLPFQTDDCRVASELAFAAEVVRFHVTLLEHFVLHLFFSFFDRKSGSFPWVANELKDEDADE